MPNFKSITDDQEKATWQSELAAIKKKKAESGELETVTDGAEAVIAAADEDAEMGDE